MGSKAKRNKKKREAAAAAAAAPEAKAANAFQPAQPNDTPRHPPRGKLDHLTRSELELRRVALSQAGHQVSSKLKVWYRRSRVAAVALSYIMDEKGLQLSRPEEVAAYWGLEIHARDFDGAVYQSYDDVGGRNLLDYGDLQADYVEPRESNPFKPREEVKVKKEPKDDGDSTMTESLEGSTTCGYVDPENKENVLEFVERMGWQPGKKRNADEFDADNYHHDEGRETDLKRAKTS